jgi:hypothetical protein
MSNGIESPELKGKLDGFQEVSNDFGVFVTKLYTDMQQKKGVVAAAKMIAARIGAERGPVQKAVDSDEMDPEEAKIRMDVILHIVRIIEDIENGNRGDISLIQGRIEGVKRAGDLVEDRFKKELAKYERQTRMFDEDGGDRFEPIGGEPVDKADVASEPVDGDKEVDKEAKSDEPQKNSKKKKKSKKNK